MLGRPAAQILFVSGGSGITPVMSMLRTLRTEGFDGDIAFIHYARAEEARYRDELAALPGVRVLHGYTRTTGRRRSAYFVPTIFCRGDAGTGRGVYVRTAGPGAGRPRALRQRQFRELRPADLHRSHRIIRRPNRFHRYRYRRHR